MALSALYDELEMRLIILTMVVMDLCLFRMTFKIGADSSAKLVQPLLEHSVKKCIKLGKFLNP